MNKFVKKYWSHILNIFFMIFVNGFLGFCIYAMNNTDALQNVPLVIMPIMIFVELILAFFVLGEMIYAIIQAVKIKELNNKALHILGLYFLNVLYIPCFLLKYVHKDEKTTIKNIIYIIVVILLMVCFTILSGMLSLSQVHV